MDSIDESVQVIEDLCNSIEIVGQADCASICRPVIEDDDFDYLSKHWIKHVPQCQGEAYTKAKALLERLKKGEQ